MRVHDVASDIYQALESEHLGEEPSAGVALQHRHDLPAGGGARGGGEELPAVPGDEPQARREFREAGEPADGAGSSPAGPHKAP